MSVLNRLTTTLALCLGLLLAQFGLASSSILHTSQTGSTLACDCCPQRCCPSPADAPAPIRTPCAVCTAAVVDVARDRSASDLAKLNRARQTAAASLDWLRASRVALTLASDFDPHPTPLGGRQILLRRATLTL